MNAINIAFVTDNNYYRHMCVTIESIIRNNYKNNKIRIFILDCGISSENITLLKERYINKDNILLEFINIDISNILDLQTKTHVSTAAFAKIFIANLINTDKVIYLDCDLVINDDIETLWNEFEKDIVLKAVWNPFYDYDNKYLGIYDNRKTFNSGVMLLNLKLMREDNSFEKLKEFLYKYNDKTKLHDQAAFNAIFKDKWKELDLKWNVQVSMINNYYKNLELSKEEYFKLYNKASIIHFTSNSKPWQFRNYNPYKNIYKNIYENIFGKTQYNDIGIKSLLKKIKEYFRFKYYYLLNLLF